MNTTTHVPSGLSSQVKRGVARWIVRETLGIVMLAAMLFLAAGTPAWIAGWAMVIVMAGWVLATAVVVIPRNPELLAERVGPKKGTKTWDTVLLSLYGTVMMILWIVAGLDVRNGWSSGIGPAVQVVALVIVIAGYGLVVWATGTNAFFSQVVRIQTDRGQYVVTTGPYRYVRHPSYVGMLLVMMTAPLMLGSWWALLPGCVSALLLIIRTKLEDQTLRAELPGYSEYAQRVRYRLIPGIW